MAYRYSFLPQQPLQHLSITPGKADGEFGAIPELCMIFASCGSGNMLFKLILILGVFKF